MAATTPSMGLKRWDNPNDVFSYVDLSDNWVAVDNHDHSTGKGVQIPTAGIANLAVDSTKLANGAVTAAKIPINSVASDRLVNSTVLDTKLASPNNSVWRTLSQAGGMATSMNTGIVHGFSAGGVMIPSAQASTVVPAIIPWDDAYYIVANKTTKLRVLGVVATNTVASAVNFTLALNPVSASGGAANLISMTLGAAIAGSGVTVTTPGASTRNSLVGTEFDAPADGFYALTVTASGNQASTSMLAFNAYLQIRHV